MLKHLNIRLQKFGLYGYKIIDCILSELGVCHVVDHCFSLAHLQGSTSTLTRLGASDLFQILLTVAF